MAAKQKPARREEAGVRSDNVTKLARQHTAAAVERLAVLAKSENHCVGIAAVTMLMKLAHGDVLACAPAHLKRPKDKNLTVTIRKFKGGDDAE